MPNQPHLLKEELKKARDLMHKQNELIKRLKMELEIETGRVKILKADNEQLKRQSVELHASQEIEEEQITNKLLKHIMGLKKEKNDILQQMEQEEEYLTNSLQKRLAQLQKEKIELEVMMETEQEFIVNRLTRQLDDLKKRSPAGSSLSINLPPPSSSISHSASASLALNGDDDMSSLRRRLSLLEKEHEQRISLHQQEIKFLREELNRLKMTRVPNSTPTETGSRLESRKSSDPPSLSRPPKQVSKRSSNASLSDSVSITRTSPSTISIVEQGPSTDQPPATK